MKSSHQRDKENWENVRGFLLAAGARGETTLRKLQQERSEKEKGSSCGSNNVQRPTANEKLIHQAEAMAGLLEELAERVHLLRDELWQMRAELAQRGVER
jgi:uncharacterized small protein (DUF1192 family)